MNYDEARRQFPVLERTAYLNAGTNGPLARSTGTVGWDLPELDCSTVSARKWRCGPDPAGARYVRDPDIVRVKTPSYFAQESYELTGAFGPRGTAAGFDGGWVGVPGFGGV